MVHVAEVPPYELLVNPKPQWQHTYVVKGDTEASDAFNTFAMAKAVCGAGMWAIHQTRNEAYLVITFPKGGCEKRDQRGPLPAARGWQR